jgi:hypothetical protein
MPPTFVVLFIMPSESLDYALIFLECGEHVTLSGGVLGSRRANGTSAASRGPALASRA